MVRTRTSKGVLRTISCAFAVGVCIRIDGFQAQILSIRCHIIDKCNPLPFPFYTETVLVIHHQHTIYHSLTLPLQAYDPPPSKCVSSVEKDVSNAGLNFWTTNPQNVFLEMRLLTGTEIFSPFDVETSWLRSSYYMRLLFNK